MNAKEEIAQLTQELNHHSDLYYNQDAPVITDSQYDEMMNRLKQLEAENPELIQADSPTQRVGGKAVLGNKIQHIVPMLSLRDVFDREEVSSFVNSAIHAQAASAPLFTVEQKIDGLAISLEYKDGVFVRGATRGDGETGEEVTSALKAVKSVPKKLKQPYPGVLVLRGEIYMPRAAFDRAHEQ